jgi:hypothetical protein
MFSIDHISYIYHIECVLYISYTIECVLYISCTIEYVLYRSYRIEYVLYISYTIEHVLYISYRIEHVLYKDLAHAELAHVPRLTGEAVTKRAPHQHVPCSPNILLQFDLQHTRNLVLS